MFKREYFNVRSGAQTTRLTFEQARRLVHDAYVRMAEEYFQEWFGYHCVDQGFVRGRAGDLQPFVYRETLIDGVADITVALASCPDEATLFTFIEFLDEHVSKGISSFERREYHSYQNCGWHYTLFQKTMGQKAWREALCAVLAHYGDGYLFAENGDIQSLGPSGLRDIMGASMPMTATSEDRQKIESAVQRFRRARATRKEHVDAVRDLADILEKLRPHVKENLLTKDEGMLFAFANRFGIRHYNENQQTDYDGAWLAWMFYVYLATIHLVLRLIERGKGGG